MNNDQLFKIDIQVLDSFTADFYKNELDKCKDVVTSVPMYIEVAKNKLSLGVLNDKSMGTVFVDFIDGKMGHRRKFGGGKKSEAVAKACFGKYNSLKIFDATAGLGRDAFVCCYLGAEVYLFERNPVVRLLLRNGLDRAYQDENIGSMLKERMHLVEQSSIIELNPKGLVLCKPETVYLDPMYPEHKSSALVKKEMRLFHYLVGHDTDVADVLNQAMQIASYRVIMKNPKWAPIVDSKNYIDSITTKNHRFDIYKPF